MDLPCATQSFRTLSSQIRGNLPIHRHRLVLLPRMVAETRSASVICMMASGKFKSVVISGFMVCLRFICLADSRFRPCSPTQCQRGRLVCCSVEQHVLGRQSGRTLPTCEIASMWTPSLDLSSPNIRVMVVCVL